MSKQVSEWKQEYYLSLYKEYLELINFKEVCRKLGINEKNISFQTTAKLLKYETLNIRRYIRNFRSLMFDRINNRINNFMVAFRVTSGTYSTIYGYAAGDISNDDFTIKHICFCPTYTSRDGEYRHRVINYNILRTWWEYRYNDVAKHYEELVVQSLQANEIQFQVQAHTNKFESEILNEINKERLAIKGFIICLVIDYPRITGGYIENHINIAYKTIFGNQLYAELYEKFRHQPGHRNDIAYLSLPNVNSGFNIDNLYQETVKNPTSRIYTFEVGQKLIPLTYYEIINMGDVSFGFWRENFISLICADLAHNNITPCFPFVGNWHLIPNSRPQMYDNPSMYEKYEHAGISEEITKRLKQADQYNYINREYSKGPINSKFNKLSHKLHKSIDYANSMLRLTDLSVCVFSEYVGRTLYDTPYVAAYDLLFNKNMHMIYTDIEMTKKHLFEFIYTLYCMNRQSILHGDLHVNNVTMRYIQITLEADKSPYELYCIDGVYYAFKYIGYNSCIIDFSQSIYTDYNFISKEFGEATLQKLRKDHTNKLLNIINHHFPKFYKRYRDNIEQVIATNFEDVFKVVSIIDVINITNNFYNLVNSSPIFIKGVLKMPPETLTFIKEIYKYSYDYGLNLLQRLIDPEELQKIANIEFPSCTVLREMFKDCRLTKERANQLFNIEKNYIADIYDSDNPIKYSCKSPEKFKLAMSIEYYYDYCKKHNKLTEGIITQYEDFYTDYKDDLDNVSINYAKKNEWMY